MQPSIVTTSRPNGVRRHRRLEWILLTALAAAFLVREPVVRAGYVLYRAAAIQSTDWALAQSPRLDSRHFTVYYPKGQATEAHVVLASLEKALPMEEKNLDVRVSKPLTVVMYGSAAAMNQAVGEPSQADNIGYEYRGVIDVLSPGVWLGSDAQALHAFLQQGPTDHELGHALLALKADMNYPAWFNEGVAQYEDFRATGYQWITPSNALTGQLYSMGQLGNRTFYALSNQSRAYREGLALVTYLETVRGHGAFVSFLNRLQDGQSFNGALNSVYHFPSQNSLFDAWHSTVRH